MMSMEEGESTANKFSDDDSDRDLDLDQIIADSWSDATAGGQLIDNQRNKTHFASLHSRLDKAGARSESLNFGVSMDWNSDNKVEAAQSESTLYQPGVLQSPPVERVKVPVKSNVGKGWFNMEPTPLTEELKRDVKIIHMRNYLDSKRFYKNPDKTGKILHVGTIIAGSADSKSARLTKKERKQSIIDEVLADKRVRRYSKHKYMSIQSEKSNKRRTFKKRTVSKNFN